MNDKHKAKATEVQRFSVNLRTDAEVQLKRIQVAIRELESKIATLEDEIAALDESQVDRLRELVWEQNQLLGELTARQSDANAKRVMLEIITAFCNAINSAILQGIYRPVSRISYKKIRDLYQSERDFEKFMIKVQKLSAHVNAVVAARASKGRTYMTDIQTDTKITKSVTDSSVISDADAIAQARLIKQKRAAAAPTTVTTPVSADATTTTTASNTRKA